MYSKGFYGPLFFALAFWGCSTKTPPNLPEYPAQEAPNDPHIFSEIEELTEQANSLLRDSLWLEAGELSDSALVKLLEIQSIDSLDTSGQNYAKKLKDQLFHILTFSTAKNFNSGEEIPLGHHLDLEIESVTPEEINEHDAYFKGIQFSKMGLPVPQPVPLRVKQAMIALLAKKNNYFSNLLSRMSRYEPFIYAELDKAGLPRELIYLAMVESGFNTKAYSTAQASGIWQFIPETGKRYGMEGDWWIDERRDPLKSTAGAIAYLGKLYAEFKDWHLAMAAYNCGENRIRRHLRENPKQSFWEMPLPKETQNYVPKILASMILGTHRAKFGLETFPQEIYAVDTVRIEHSLSLEQLAKMANITVDSIKLFNPELRRWCTPPNKMNYLVKVPAGLGPAFEQAYLALNKEDLVRWQRHVVRSGETLTAISNRYNVPVQSIKKANHLKGMALRRGQQLLIPLPVESVNIPPTETNSTTNETTRPTYATYTVRPGDNLYDIARRFNTNIETLRKLNHLSKRKSIHPRQKLRVPRGIAENTEVAPVEAGAESESTSIDTAFSKVQVQEGETLYRLAEKLDVTVNQLKEWNNLTSSAIQAGDWLSYLPSKNARPVGVYYLVKPGDNLYDIAQKFNTTIESIKNLNPQLGQVLKSGTRIRVR